MLCPICGENHFINLCKQFRIQTIHQRRDLVQVKGLCFNCLQPSHIVSKQQMCCKKCERRHNTIHFEKEGFTENANNIQRENKQGVENTNTFTLEPRIIANFAKSGNKSYNVLLATTLLKGRSNNGNIILISAL